MHLAGPHRRSPLRGCAPLLLALAGACGDAAPPPPPEPPPAMAPPVLDLDSLPLGELAARPDRPRGFYPDDPAPERTAYLTFDDGPSEWTEGFLDVLADKGVKATFFITALGGGVTPDTPYVEPRTGRRLFFRDTIRRTLDEGHLIGNHTAGHPDLAALSPEEIAAEIDHNQALIGQALVGAGGRAVPISIVRPPYGRPFLSGTPEQMLHVGAVLGAHGINALWNLPSTDSDDWAIGEWYRNEPQPPDMASKWTFAEKVERERRAIVESDLVRQGKGVVILMHDTHPCSRDALPAIIDGLRAAGYRFGTMEDYVRWRWGRPSMDLTPGPYLYRREVWQRDWGCADFSRELGAPRHTRAHEVCGRLWEAFQGSGGAAALGRPLSPVERDPGSGVLRQRFERARLELHPENDRPADVKQLPQGGA